MDHFFSMVKVLNGEENGHGKCKKGDQTHDNLKSEALMKLYLSHHQFPEAEGSSCYVRAQYGEDLFLLTNILCKLNKKSIRFSFFFFKGHPAKFN